MGKNGSVTNAGKDGIPLVIVVMGVSGSGKTTVGELLSRRLGWEYADADEFHPAANVAKMQGGTPLTDADRWPWLHKIAEWIGAHVASGTPGVVSCSALKGAYRELLIQGRLEVRLVYLDGDRDVIAGRMKSRKGHFFMPEMLDSQFRDLEPPTPAERPLKVSIDGSPEETVQQIIEGLGLEGD